MSSDNVIFFKRIYLRIVNGIMLGEERLFFGSAVPKGFRYCLKETCIHDKRL
jgi:hypothetical protein